MPNLWYPIPLSTRKNNFVYSSYDYTSPNKIIRYGFIMREMEKRFFSLFRRYCHYYIHVFTDGTILLRDNGIVNMLCSQRDIENTKTYRKLCIFIHLLQYITYIYTASKVQGDEKDRFLHMEMCLCFWRKRV